METFFKEAGWTATSFCTLWKREKALGPVGNGMTILDTSIPWPNHFIEYPGPSCFDYDYKFLVWAMPVFPTGRNKVAPRVRTERRIR